MRILVTGSRDWADVGRVCIELTELLRSTERVTVVHGACPTGADAIAHCWASNVPGATPEPHPADWKRHGKAAGPIRNQEMVDLGADICLAFPLGESRGTRDCMRRAVAAGIPVRVFGEDF